MSFLDEGKAELAACAVALHALLELLRPGAATADAAAYDNAAACLWNVAQLPAAAAPLRAARAPSHVLSAAAAAAAARMQLLQDM
jgi:hypothetical protein